MKLVLRVGCLVAALATLGTSQVVQSEHFVLNAGLTKALGAANPSAVAFSRDGTILATIDKAGTLMVFDAASGAAKGSAQAHNAGKAAVAISPLGDTIATWGQDQKVSIWNASGLGALKTVATFGGKPGSIAYSGDGSRIACGGEDGSIRVFSVHSGNAVSNYKAHGGAVMALAFEPSGQTIVSVGKDRKMTTADVESGKVSKSKFLPVKIQFDAKPEDEFQQIRSAACTPDGSIFALGGYNFYRQLAGMGISYEFVILYDRSGRRLVQIGDKTTVNTSLAVSISPDGKLVGTSAPNGMMRIWDVQHNQLCGQPGNQGSIKMTAATKVGNNYLFAVAGASANLIGVTPTEAQAAPVGEQEKSVSEGLSIEFAGPTEIAPIVSSANLEVSAVVSGLKSDPRYTIELAGQKKEPVTLQPSDNKELVSALAPRGAGDVGQAVAVKVTPETIRISQSLVLSEGPNRIKVTVQDGGRQVTAVKTVCFVPEGDTLDRSRVYSESYALLIGVNKYSGKNGKNIPALQAAVADAEEMGQVLKSQYGFKEVTVLTDANATRSKIMAELAKLTDASRIKPNDRVIVFWSGHGQTVTAPEGGQIGFLLPTDAAVDFTNLDNIRPYRETCVPMDELGRLAREIPAKHVLFLVDACFSGLAATRGNAYPTNAFGLVHQAFFDARQIITASSQFEPAKEKNGHGYFTKAVLDAFQDGAADENKDSYLTASELYKYVLPKVQTMNSNQSPRMAKFSLGIGETLFFK